MGQGTGGGRSENNPTTTTTTTNVQKTVNNVDNSIHTSDFGAISSAENIAKAAIESSSQTSKIFANNSFDLASNTLSSEEHIVNDVTDFAKGALNSSLDFAATEHEGNLNFLHGLQDFTTTEFANLQEQNAKTLSGTVEAINEIGVQRNTSADQRIQDLSTTALKIGLGMVALIAATIIFTNHKAHA